MRRARRRRARDRRAAGSDTLVFCGCNFPNCPRTSIYEASERDFRIVLAHDALSGLYERGERELGAIGVLMLAAGEIESAIPVVSPPTVTVEASDQRP
jgi:hypothetical protein